MCSLRVFDEVLDLEYINLCVMERNGGWEDGVRLWHGDRLMQSNKKRRSALLLPVAETHKSCNIDDYKSASKIYNVQHCRHRYLSHRKKIRVCLVLHWPPCVTALILE